VILVDCETAGGRGRNFEWWQDQLEFLPRATAVSVQGPLSPVDPEIDQREKMLSAFVMVAPAFVFTPYWLKFDTDVVATRGGEWIDPAWFADEPVIVAHRWGVTRPKENIHRLDHWAAGVPWLAHLPVPVEIPAGHTGDTVHHERFTGWLQFTRTDWSQKYAELLAGQRLPISSQDTFHWYCAAREQLPIVRAQMKSRGWDHVRRNSTLQELAAKALAQ
jgi:hypothetical protein